MDDDRPTRINIWDLMRRRLKQEYKDLGLPEEEADAKADSRVRQIIIDGNFDT